MLALVIQVLKVRQTELLALPTQVLAVAEEQ
jgi:hypothetical protein